MDVLALNHLRNRLAAALRELDTCATAAHQALNARSWTGLASYAAQAGRAAGLAEAFQDAITAAEGS